MCGICGTTDLSMPRAVEAMNARLEHRGPDDEGVFVDDAGGVALGARRLSVIDVDGGHQPLANEDESVWAVFNGEIYNHRALQAHLRGRGHTLRSRTDTEVLVHLYEEYGDALVHALEGMFAFAIWDKRRRRLLLGRDRFGEKPLFYSHDRGRLVFASEVTALLAGLAETPELAESAVDAFFTFGYVPGPSSIFAGIDQVPPAHVLAWERDDRYPRVTRYWSVPQSARPEDELALGDVVDEAHALLERSVRDRMISDVPLGVLLSGGVDSTLIAALAARASPQPVKTFTVGYDVGDVSESDGARRAAAEIGTDHHELTLTSDDVAGHALDVLARVDQPLADQALLATHAVARFARQEVTVAIGGEGADELFGGYPRYRWLERAERLDRALPHPIARAAGRVSATLPLPRRQRIADVLRPSPNLERHLDWVTAGRRHLRGDLYGPRLANALARPTTLAALRHAYAGAGGNENGDVDGRGVAGGMMALDQRHWLPDDVLAKADRASMLVSLELRTPYLHHELAELCATVPPSAHLAGGGKAILRAILGRVVPGRLARRPKTAFRVPAGDWLRGSLAGPLLEHAQAGPAIEEGWFDGPAVGRMAREHVNGAEDRTAALWPFLCFAIWLDGLRGHARA